MVVIVGKRSGKRAGIERLFGRIFSEQSYVCADKSVEINDPHAVVIIANGARAEVADALAVVVGDTDFSDYPHGIQLITCGISHKNTVSITSRSADRITLSLNRAIHGASGTVEPLEYPADFLGNFTEFDYMAAFAASLLLN